MARYTDNLGAFIEARSVQWLPKLQIPVIFIVLSQIFQYLLSAFFKFHRYHDRESDKKW